MAMNPLEYFVKLPKRPYERNHEKQHSNWNGDKNELHQTTFLSAVERPIWLLFRSPKYEYPRIKSNRQIIFHIGLA